jgi:sialate O-acetylesterase
MHRLPEIDLYNVDCYVVNGESAEQMIGWVKQAVATNSLLVILFHGVNGGNALNVSSSAHSQLLHYLKQSQKDIWVGPMIELADYISRYQSANKKHQVKQ